MPANDPLLLRFDDFELDERQMRLSRGGQPVPVPPKAFGVLCRLARQPGQLVRKDELLDAVWGHRHVSESVLKTTVSELRGALRDDAKAPRYIETASRHGYRFIAGPPTAAAAPAVAAGATLPWLIGRQAARARLHQAWQRASAGQRQVVWLAGEAGIGKTTLIDHFAAECGALAARGQCVEQHGAGEPHLPVLEALSALCREQPALQPLLRQFAPSWLMQLPWLAGEGERAALREQLAGAGQDRMLREFGELVEHWTADRPLLLVTEDLHWSDRSTLRLIDHLARRRGPARLMWLASFRVTEVLASDHPLKWLRQELRLHGLVDEIALESFSEREVADYLARRAPGQAISETLARTLHRRTDGLPLFLVSLVDEWMAAGETLPDPVAAPAGPASQAWAVPESLAGFVERQFARLPAEHQQLLEAAAVCGQEFRVGTLADVLDRDCDGVASACDALARSGQWLGPATVEEAPDGTIDARHAFRHALYRQVLRQHLGALQRGQLHRRAAAVLAGSRQAGASVSPAELALHHEGGQQWLAALHEYAEAAAQALRRFAPDEAMSLTGHALALLPRCPEGLERDRAELALLGRRMTASQILSADAPQARAAFDRVRVLHQRLPDDTSGFDIEIGWLHHSAADYAQALTIAQGVHAGSDAGVNRVRHVAACHLLGATLVTMGRLQEGRRYLDEGLQAATELGDWPANALAVVDLQVSLRCRLGQALVHLGCIEPAHRHLEAAHARASRLGPYARRLALVFTGLLEVKLGEVQRAQAAADELARLATEAAMPQAAGPAAWLRGWVLAHQGDPQAGHALICEGERADAALGLRRGRSALLGWAAEASMLAGRLHEARQGLAEALAFCEATGEQLHLPDLLLLGRRLDEAQLHALQARKEPPAPQR